MLKVIFEFQGKPLTLEASPSETLDSLLIRYTLLADLNINDIKFYKNGKELKRCSQTLDELELSNYTNIDVISAKYVIGAGGAWLVKRINIKFIKTSKNNYNKNHLKCQLKGLLKLCLLNEISSKLDINELKMFPEMIFYIMKILKRGYIEANEDIKNTIKEVLQKIKGSNIINFSE